MQLHFKKTGEGTPLIILHGLFGSGDNWMSFARMVAEKGFTVYQVDLRNHGHSPHATPHNYKAMSDDVHELISSEKLENVIVLGHSMGGKTGMQLAIDHTKDLEALIVVDIATHYYPIHHKTILDALISVKTEQLKSRDEAQQQLSLYIKDDSTIQFLMKGLYRKDEHFAWRFNIPVLNEQIDNVGEEMKSDKGIDLPVLFVRGEKSNYIDPGKFDECRKLFPKAELVTIPGAGHWVHAEKPEELLRAVLNFLVTI